MAQLDHPLFSDAIHPIDIAETVAAHRDWSCDRLADDRLTLAMQGQWRSYAITLAWCGRDEVLRLVCSFDMDPPVARQAALYEVLNLANDAVWEGGFAFWAAQRLMVWRYGLVLSGGAIAAPEQIDRMIRSAVDSCERFYPAFQLTCWGDTAPAAAIGIAMGEAYGRA
ncbi:YbjN domain-containing protein [Paracoccus contaminans]|uniref:Diacylglyceryl transferase n=1 Tax=Paracoccus contaminans TaxID=1945662 RepID=A0A1W6CZ39_9RHOB|nr:YbjN domain-containing protein [Paracoccus contaminans]ARJ70137.1 diacylglyceryl transferase [Paracoccus contaminans]